MLQEKQHGFAVIRQLYAFGKWIEKICGKNDRAPPGAENHVKNWLWQKRITEI
jgi:hypothetical protein